MNEKIREQLIATAVAACQQAYAPYSQFQVGAALLGNGGLIYTGVNVENASYGLTNCAERTAVFSAIAAGERVFEAMAIASTGGVAPCGACRQVLYEFAPHLTVLMIDVTEKNRVTEVSLEALLPAPFSPDRES
ncbi:MAG: cytidine deaminase [Pirellulales bacterium]|nr:cytidine deaminase [Pirellulales bacterium]